jgi:hypothetical protein
VDLPMHLHSDPFTSGSARSFYIFWVSVLPRPVLFMLIWDFVSWKPAALFRWSCIASFVLFLHRHSSV